MRKLPLRKLIQLRCIKMELKKKTVIMLQFASDMPLAEIEKISNDISQKYGYAFSDLRPAMILE